MSESKTLATQCFESLMDSILRGEILPGEKLLCDELKKQLNVGMSPVREALSKLATTHLVTFEEHKGYSVSKMNPSKICDDIDTFAEIESLCLKQAIEKGDHLWEGSIIAALHSLSKFETAEEIDYFTWAPLNVNFHNALVSACPLRSLLQIRNELYQRHQWYILLSYKFADHAMICANHQEHQRLCEAVVGRKSNACKMLFDHITSGKEDLIAKLRLINEK